MIKQLAGLAIVVFLAVTGFKAWDHYVSVEHPPALLMAEEALATHALVALGSVSIAHAVRLEDAFLGAPDTAGAAEQGLLAGTPFARLQAAGIDPRRDLGHLVFAFYLDASEQPGYALAVLGHFDRAKVLAGLEDDYEVSHTPEIDPAVWRVSRQNVDTCEWSQPWSVYISDGLIVAADPVRLPALLARLTAQSPAQRNLARWRDFRATQVGSLALFVPDQAPQTGNPVMQRPVSQAHDALEAFNEVYFGMGLWPLPFRTRFEMMLAGEDAVAASAAVNGWQAALLDSKQQWGKQLPTVARLHEAVSVSEAQGALLMQASVDRAWFEEAAKLPQELLGLMFRGAGLHVAPSAEAAAAPQERLDENPARFLARISPEALPAYRAEPPFLPGADTVSGPFGIRLSAVELGDGEDAGLVLTVSAVHRGIPNLGKGKGRVQLYVESVTDAQGKELLRTETCGRERNPLPAAIDSPHFSNSVRGEKRVRLKAGVRQADIHRIHGRVELLLPVTTERLQLAALEQEQRIDRDGIRVVLNRTATDTLDYKVYGDPRRLLAVRGLNAGAQPLSGTSSLSSGFLFGEGQSKSQSYAGEVAAAELVLALSDAEQRFPFELSRARPRVTQSETTQAPVRVPTYSLAELQREFKGAPSVPEDATDSLAETGAGPFRITLNRLQSFFGLQAGFRVYAPVVPGLADSLAALALEVTAVENAAGENLIGEQAVREVLQLGEDWQDKTRLQGQASLHLETRAEVADIRTLKGRLHLQLPQAIRSVYIESMEVGTQAGAGGSAVTLQRVDDKGFSLDFGTRQPALLAVNAYNRKGEGLWVPHPSLQHRDGRWLGRFDTHGSPARVELLLATVLEQQAFAFELTPPDKTGSGNSRNTP
jgi:hypothetical protein